jgi:hypothetical protein
MWCQKQCRSAMLAKTKLWKPSDSAANTRRTECAQTPPQLPLAPPHAKPPTLQVPKTSPNLGPQFEYFSVFLEFIWIFSGRNQCFQHSEYKSYQINSIKSWSSIFPTTPKAHTHSNSSKIFSYDFIYLSVKKLFNSQELLHHKSKCHETKLMHPSSVTAFKRDQEHNLKHPGSVHLISTNKTKKLPCFIDRFFFHKLKKSWHSKKKNANESTILPYENDQ